LKPVVKQGSPRGAARTQDVQGLDRQAALTPRQSRRYRRIRKPDDQKLHLILVVDSHFAQC
jgi:hypothetical protein